VKDFKSRSRFESQFVGVVSNSTKKIYGAPATFGFINIVSGANNVQQIGITRAGVEFALLKNLIIDEQNFSNGAISSDEAHFLLNHIHENLPGESQGFRLILQEIASGHSNPGELSQKIKSTFGYEKDTMVASIQVGLVGRMVELGLISRERSGTSVNYKLTARGEEGLRNFSNRLVSKEVGM
jgi:hypothetical protein